MEKTINSETLMPFLPAPTGGANGKQVTIFQGRTQMYCESPEKSGGFLHCREKVRTGLLVMGCTRVSSTVFPVLISLWKNIDIVQRFTIGCGIIGMEAGWGESKTGKRPAKVRA
ncbi:hypothetical protein J2Z49_001462 [Desulfofundulus luciae]|uniref:Uncharacterized protein n=1 Tax=Desulfofundulus luciae TaxID=74702 RepID=A0ABU0B0U6_9FIRM|nr:hypothetical protein [Desulfofundulus luciae]MDQ0286348.1 hypothetical protein [Desulfofundulus luciae]